MKKLMILTPLLLAVLSGCSVDDKSHSNKAFTNDVGMIAAANSQLAHSQAEKILELYFDQETNKKGEVVYMPKTATLSITRGVIEPELDKVPKLASVESKFDIPLLTLSPLQFLGIDSMEFEDGQIKRVHLKEIKIPIGISTIVEAYSNSISPATLPSAAE